MKKITIEFHIDGRIKAAKALKFIRENLFQGLLHKPTADMVQQPEDGSIWTIRIEVNSLHGSTVIERLKNNGLLMED